MIGLGMATDADTVLHYLMDELSGPYIDVVGGFNCAAYGLATETWREGKARPFVGSNYGMSPIIPEAVRAAFCGVGTAEVVAMLARVNADHALFDARGPTGDGTPADNYIGRAIVTQAGGVAQFWEWGDGWTQYDHTYGVGVPHWEWVHLALVHGAEADGTIIERVYLNGVEVAQSAPVHPPSGGEAARLYIGRSDSAYLRGLIAEMRFSRVARSPAEILESYERTVVEFLQPPEPVDPPSPPPPEPPPPPPEPIGNPRVSQELGLTGGRLDTDEGLSVAVMCSLFSDARIDEAEARARGIDDRRGYWADAFSASGPWGSTIWALSRAGKTQETALLVGERAKKALDWLIKAGVAASVDTAAVAVESLNPRIELTVRIRRPAAPGETYLPTWERIYAL